MALFGRKRTTVGLDIGSGLIKLVAIQHGGGSEPVLTKVAFTSVVDDAIVEGEVMDPGIVAEAIKQLMAVSGIKAKQVVTAVGGHSVIIKKITMPLMAHWAVDDAPFPIAKVDELEKMLTGAGVNFEFHRYQAMHAFANETQVGANRLPITEYKPEAAATAWERTLDFWRRTLR